MTAHSPSTRKHAASDDAKAHGAAPASASPHAFVIDRICPYCGNPVPLGMQMYCSQDCAIMAPAGNESKSGRYCPKDHFTEYYQTKLRESGYVENARVPSLAEYFDNYDPEFTPTRVLVGRARLR